MLARKGLPPAVASTIRFAPITHSAAASAVFASPVSNSGFPIPSPITLTRGETDIPNREARYCTSSVKRMPPCSGGRPMMSTEAPSLRAAAIFSAKPPLGPESLVTRCFACAVRIIARLSSSLNGPCIAMMCAGGIPAASQAARELCMGSTRA